MQTLQATTLIAILLVASPVWGDLKLVDNGKTHTVIIIPEDASFVTDSAARQIQRYLKQISGGDVAIHIENSFSFEPDYYWIGPAFSVISIGQTKLAADAGLSVARLAPEGFTIQTKGNVLFILGREDRTDTTQLRSTKWNSVHWPLRQRGTLFGVYTFLEDYLGVRWLWPGHLGEVVPKQQDVVIGDIDRIGSPAMATRIVHPPHIAGAFRTGSHNLDESHASHLQRAYDADVWVERQKLGRSLIIDQAHAYGDAFWNKYHVDHPQWFAVQPDGKRMSKQRLAGRVRRCHSNRQLQEEVARIVLDKLAKNPDVWSVGVGLDDTSPETFCKCDECKAFGPTLTDRVVRFDSAIAELVARKHPDKRISMFAYAEWKDAPIEAKLHPNVVVVYVGVYTHGYLYASDRQENHSLWNNWSKMIEGKMLWRPNMPESLGIPIVYAHQWAEDLKRFAPKAWGVDVDGLRGSWASAGLTQYVMAKLLWNPDQQVDAIIEDYCQAGFRPAENPIGQYFAALEQYTSEAAKQAPAAGYHKFCPWAPTFYTSQRLAKLQSLLDQGCHLAGDDRVVVNRIEFLQVGLDWTKMALKAWAIYAADGDRDQARPLVGELYDYLRKHRESYAIYSGYLEAKIGWMWKEFFGEEAKENWSRTF